MWASAFNEQVIELSIESEGNSNGFLDSNVETNTFKAQILNINETK
jgi:hypothetical protein